MRLVVKTYKYKLYNSKKNRYLVRQIELASEIWNFCIAMRRMYYLVYGKKLKANDLKKRLRRDRCLPLTILHPLCTDSLM